MPLIGSRPRGLFLRRPREQRNADRARLLLGMPYALACGSTEEAIAEVASLLDQRIEVRAALSPVVVAKYLYWRQTTQRRRLFRRTRKAVAEASAYARAEMISAKGILDPGLMPQSLDELRQIAPPRDLVDDELVERWNRCGCGCLAAGQLALHVMGNKQIELTTPSFRGGSSADQVILAVWRYQDNSLVLVHIDFQGAERYAFWHAPRAHQEKFDKAADLLYQLGTLNMEVPQQLYEALSRRHRS